MLRGGVGGRKIIHQEGEFSIPLPAQNSSQGVARVDILNLEELPERPKKQVRIISDFCFVSESLFLAFKIIRIAC